VAQCCHHISISAEFNFSLGANITTWAQILSLGRKHYSLGTNNSNGRKNYCLGANITTWA
jgi:hypothetical protein